MVYNAAFFRAHEAYFLEVKKRFGEDVSLDVMRTVMENTLRKAYMEMGFKFGKPKEFARIVGRRDSAIGLDIAFTDVSDSHIIYEFHTDPFPGLKGHVAPEKLDATYMNFKVNFILGDNWRYNTIYHIWKDKLTRHIIEKK